MRGTSCTSAARVCATHPDSLPADIDAELIAIADARSPRSAARPLVEAFWRPHFERFARWFAATEPARRAGIVASTEVDGGLELDVAHGFNLTARADRIDVADDGTVVIYDYKTGKPPLAKHVDKLFAPQLPLEAAIAEGGGFAAIGPPRGPAPSATSRRLGPQRRRRGAAGGVEGRRPTSPKKALADLTELIARFDDPETPYEVKRRGAGLRQRLSLRRLRAPRPRQGMAHARGRGGVPMSARAPAPARSRRQSGARLRSPRLGLGVGQCRHRQDRGAGQARACGCCSRAPAGEHPLPDLHQDGGGGDAEPPAQGARPIGRRSRPRLAREARRPARRCAATTTELASRGGCSRGRSRPKAG